MKTALCKILSLLLAVLVFFLVSSFGTFAFSKDTSSEGSISASADEVRPEDIPCNENCYRYFFYLPLEWENEYTQTAGIYWWEGTGAQKYWPGVEARKTSVEGLYFYDVPKDVTSIIWNNFIDGGTDTTQAIYKSSQQTKNIGTEYYEEGESEFYPEGTENFNNMVYVVDPTDVDMNTFTGKHIPGGEWFYYYGNGEYGLTPEKGDVFFSSRTFIKDKDKPTEPNIPTTPPQKEPYYTIYFENTQNWENVYIFWCINELYENNGWPGDEMTYVKIDPQGHDIYSFEVTHLADIIIFTNGEEQTWDITQDIKDGKMFWLAPGKKNGVWGCNSADYEEKTYTLGDADRNGKVNVKDATLVQLFVADYESYDRNIFNISDMDHDGWLSVKDATCIQKTIAGLI